MIKEIRGSRLLQGYRGSAVDISALKELLFNVSDLVIKNPEISELDLNPVFLYQKGYMAVDARIFLQKRKRKRICRYPQKRIEVSCKIFFIRAA
jgi:acyl-CoA synthetase (NDP forming)